MDISLLRYAPIVNVKNPKQNLAMMEGILANQTEEIKAGAQNAGDSIIEK